jgi:hypothetical protein
VVEVPGGRGDGCRACNSPCGKVKASARQRHQASR